MWSKDATSTAICLFAGSIDYEEFLAATVNLNHLEKEDTMYNAFRHFDTDNSGYITQQEMEDALSVHTMCHPDFCQTYSRVEAVGYA